VEFFTSAASNGSRVALSQHVLSFSLKVLAGTKRCGVYIVRATNGGAVGNKTRAWLTRMYGEQRHWRRRRSLDDVRTTTTSSTPRHTTVDSARSRACMTDLVIIPCLQRIEISRMQQRLSAREQSTDDERRRQRCVCRCWFVLQCMQFGSSSALTTSQTARTAVQISNDTHSAVIVFRRLSVVHAQTLLYCTIRLPTTTSEDMYNWVTAVHEDDSSVTAAAKGVDLTGLLGGT